MERQSFKSGALQKIGDEPTMNKPLIWYVLLPITASTSAILYEFIGFEFAVIIILSMIFQIILYRFLTEGSE